MADSTMKEVLADVFVAEGTRLHFTVMGNGNMWWADALARREGVRTIHARHEHCAVAMAAGYARATGDVGIASVTNGPGLTQTATELTIAALARVPLVLYAADAALGAPYSTHAFDQQTLTSSTGAHFVAVRSHDRMMHDLREAFYVARSERRPVVLSVPEDFQKGRFPHLADYDPSTTHLVTPQRLAPDPDVLAKIAKLLTEAEAPIIIAGRGAARSGAGPALAELAAVSGALLSTSLQGKGLFDGDPFNLGIAGAFSSGLAREAFAEADLVIGVGASLGHHTTEGGYLYPSARVVQIDTSPRGIWQGLKVADLHLQADAAVAAQALLAEVNRTGSPGTKLRTGELAERIAANVFDPREYPPNPGTVDPRTILREIDAAVPKDWDIVCGPAHYFNFVLTEMGGRAPDRWHAITEFGAIGSAFATAIGIAASRGDGKVLLIEGDGSMLMHIQEMETLQRHGISMLCAVLNDGAYGAEAHKFRAQGLDASETIHGRADFARIAHAFGLNGATVTTPEQIGSLLSKHLTAGGASVWDIHIDPNVPSLQYRRLHYGEE